jgi:stearoyl-CoA desaturase (delta-9 desaturase)
MRIRNWNIFFFIIGYHLLLVLLLPAFVSNFSWLALVLFLVTYVIGGISITAGYHRLYAHRSYRAHPAYEWAVLIGSTLALQMSARKWAHDHRLHHAYVDSDADPYSIKKGFWYAHVGWLFSNSNEVQPKYVRDLDKNSRVVFQYR